MQKKIALLLPSLILAALLIVLPANANQKFTDIPSNMKGAVKISSATVYSKASAKSKHVKKLKFGDKVKIKSESSKWYKVKLDSTTGFMKKSDIVKYNKKKKHIALTFDDGPNASTTGTVLKALEKNKCRATFFVVGSMISDGTSKLLKKEAALGCEIGNHSYSHSQLTRLSSSAVKGQLSRTDQKVKKYTGQKPALCRAPYGASSIRVLNDMGRPNIMWSVDTLDWKYRNTSRLISYVKSHSKDGAVILMHDIHKTTANAVDRICKDLKKKNYEMVTVTELSAIKGKKMKAGKSYNSF